MVPSSSNELLFEGSLLKQRFEVSRLYKTPWKLRFLRLYSDRLEYGKWNKKGILMIRQGSPIYLNYTLSVTVQDNGCGPDGKVARLIELRVQSAPNGRPSPQAAWTHAIFLDDPTDKRLKGTRLLSELRNVERLHKVAHGDIVSAPVSDSSSSSNSPTGGASSAPLVAPSSPSSRPEVEPPAPVAAVSPDYVARAVARRRNRPQRANGEVESNRRKVEQPDGAAPHEVPTFRSSASSVKADSSGRLVKPRNRVQSAQSVRKHVAGDDAAAKSLPTRSGRKQQNPLDNRYRPAGKNSSLQHSPRREEEKVKDSVPSDKIALSTIVSVDYEATEISSGARLRPSLHEQEKDDDDDVPRYIPGSPSEVSLRKARTTRGSEEGPLPSGQVEMEMAASSKARDEAEDLSNRVNALMRQGSKADHVAALPVQQPASKSGSTGKRSDASAPSNAPPMRRVAAPTYRDTAATKARAKKPLPVKPWKSNSSMTSQATPSIHRSSDDVFVGSGKRPIQEPRKMRL